MDRSDVHAPPLFFLRAKTGERRAEFYALRADPPPFDPMDPVYHHGGREAMEADPEEAKNGARFLANLMTREEADQAAGFLSWTYGVPVELVEGELIGGDDCITEWNVYAPAAQAPVSMPGDLSFDLRVFVHTCEELMRADAGYTDPRPPMTFLECLAYSAGDRGHRERFEAACANVLPSINWESPGASAEFVRLWRQYVLNGPWAALWPHGQIGEVPPWLVEESGEYCDIPEGGTA